MCTYITLMHTHIHSVACLHSGNSNPTQKLKVLNQFQNHIKSLRLMPARPSKEKCCLHSLHQALLSMKRYCFLVEMEPLNLQCRT